MSTISSPVVCVYICIYTWSWFSHELIVYTVVCFMTKSRNNGILSSSLLLVYTYIYIYIYIYICVCVYISMYLYIYIRTYIYMHKVFGNFYLLGDVPRLTGNDPLGRSVCVCVCVQMCVCVRCVCVVTRFVLQIYAIIHTYIHTYIYTYMLTYILNALLDYYDMCISLYWITTICVHHLCWETWSCPRLTLI
jgi:hypothetical protein